MAKKDSELIYKYISLFINYILYLLLLLDTWKETHKSQVKKKFQNQMGFVGTNRYDQE